MAQQHFFALVAAGLMLGSAAHATTMTTPTQAITFGPGLTDFAGATQQLALFDSSLGTLDAVTIGGSYGFHSTLTIINNGGNPSSGNSRTESAAAFNSGNSAIDDVLVSLLDQAGPATVGATTFNAAAIDLLGSKALFTALAGGSSLQAQSTGTTTTIAAVTDTTSSDLTAFEASGGGLFDVLFNTATGTVTSYAGGNTGADQVTTATGTVTLYYTYEPASNQTPPTTPTPEPASIAVLGVGLLGAGIVRRSRR